MGLALTIAVRSRSPPPTAAATAGARRRGACVRGWMYMYIYVGRAARPQALSLACWVLTWPRPVSWCALFPVGAEESLWPQLRLCSAHATRR